MIISMYMYLDYWIDQKIIQVFLVVCEKYYFLLYVSFKELSDSQFEFKFKKDYEIVFCKKELQQFEMEKKLIKFGEKQQIFLGIVFWVYMKIILVKNDLVGNWVVLFLQELLNKDMVFLCLFFEYLMVINNSVESKFVDQQVKGLLKKFFDFQ